MSKVVLKSFLPIVLVLTALAVRGGQETGDGPLRRTGLIPLSDEALAEVLATRPQITRVHLNRIGLERVNEARRERGLPLLDPGLARPVGRDFESAIGGRAAEVLAGAEPLAADLPAAVDNSALPSFPPIRSQGSIGSCAAFAPTYYQLSHMTALERGWDIRDPGDDTRKFSPKWTYNLVNRGYDSGTSFDKVYPILEKHGAATWAEFPYDDDYAAWCLDPAVWRNALFVRPEPAQVVKVYSGNWSLDHAKELLTNGYVLVFGTYFLSWKFTAIGDDPATEDDTGEVGKQIGYWVQGQLGGHALTIVGYNDAIWTDINGNGRIDAGEKGGFRIANSWGPEWGDGGFTWLAYDALGWASAVEGAPLWAREEAMLDYMAWVLPARAAAGPLVTAEFTLYGAHRRELQVTLGRSAVGAATPDSVWAPAALQGYNYEGSGGAFDGTSTACEAGFVMDFTDLLTGVSGPTRFHLGVKDSSYTDRLDTSVTLRAFKIVDWTTDPPAEVVCPDVPRTVDGEQIYVCADHDYRGPSFNHPPELSSQWFFSYDGLGTPDTVFIFRIDYFDEDGDLPAEASVVIDGAPWAMTLDPTFGHYELRTHLPLGRHEHYYYFRDGRGGAARAPLAGAVAGPEVFPSYISGFSRSAYVGDPGFVLSVRGLLFAEGSAVLWDGAERPTTFVSASELTVSVDAADLETAKFVPVTVRGPDGGLSNALNFPVQNYTPVLSSFSPSVASCGGPAFTLSLRGSRFAPDACVYWGGVTRAAAFVGPTELRVEVSAAEIEVYGEREVHVWNPAPGGGLSSPRAYPVSHFTVTTYPLSQTVAAGQKAQFNIQVKPQLGGFDLPVKVSLPAALPKGVTASLSTPDTVTPGTTGSGVTVILSTTARADAGSGAATASASAGGAQGAASAALGFLSVAGAVFAARASARGRSRARPTALWPGAAALVLVLLLTACSAGGGGDKKVTGTPAGTYIIEVQGKSTLITYSAVFTLIVR